MTDKKMIFVIAAKDSVPVRKPNGKYLAKMGEEVARSTFWVRRIKDGDVIDGEAAQKRKTKLAADAKKAKADSETKGE
ncbi:DUF2635 domain-containing protein [Vibrio parahaemolyticus]